MNILNSIINLANDNAGFLSIVLFLLTILLGWVSGIFSSLRKRPKYKIRILPGPTLCTTFKTGKEYQGYEVHRTAISVYLSISNIGSASSSIENVLIGYHWHIKPFSWLWIKSKIFWHWLKQPTNTLEDFQYDFGGRVKIYPSLLQGVTATMKSPDTYLEVGKGVNGVIYFEQDDSWGGCFPSPKKNMVKLKIAIIDTFGKKYTKIFWAPVVSPEEAQKYNPAFGVTLAVLRGEIKIPNEEQNLTNH